MSRMLINASVHRLDRTTTRGKYLTGIGPAYFVQLPLYLHFTLLPIYFLEGEEEGAERKGFVKSMGMLRIACIPWRTMVLVYTPPFRLRPTATSVGAPPLEL